MKFANFETELKGKNVNYNIFNLYGEFAVSGLPKGEVRLAKKPINLKLDEELIKQIQDAAEGTTPDFIRNAVLKELGEPDAETEIKELVKQQLNMYRGFMGKLDVIIDLMKKRQNDESSDGNPL